jgi:hypothetical protein
MSEKGQTQSEELFKKLLEKDEYFGQFSNINFYMLGVSIATLRSQVHSPFIMKKETMIFLLKDLVNAISAIESLKWRVGLEVIGILRDVENQKESQISTTTMNKIIQNLDIWNDRIRNTPTLENEIFVAFYTLYEGYPDNKNIINNCIEAVSCYRNACYRSCVIMCRRAVELLALKLGASSDSILFEKIEWLRKEKKIGEKDYKMAHACRVAGNQGAHTDLSDISDIDGDDARLVLQVTKRLFERIMTQEFPKKDKDGLV